MAHLYARPRIAGLYRYPVKGMTPGPLSRVSLEPGRTIPFDRVYAIENGPSRFNPAAPRHLPKINFVMLMRNEELIRLGGAELEVFRLTERCAATNVSPETGARDLKNPSFLSRTYGHTDFGVYAKLTAAGEVAVGDAVSIG